MNILVTGGAGFIGSHMVLALARAGHDVTVIDNLSNGHRDAVLDGHFVEMDVRDRERLTKLLHTRKIEAVFHLAAYIEAGVSVRAPVKFYDNNVGGIVSLLDAMQQTGVGRLIFSSTAAIYGNPTTPIIHEDAPKLPVSPYGHTKLAAEHLIEACGKAFGLEAVCLRYFNAAGADPQGLLGERHTPETHLIPLALRAAMTNSELSLFGTDYATPDGTCVRDYIHVTDLVDAHLLALRHLEGGGGSLAANLGTGRGHSVREVIGTVEDVTGLRVPVRAAERRTGDPPVLVASGSLATAKLDWTPRFPELADMVRHAWAYLSRQG